MAIGLNLKGDSYFVLMPSVGSRKIQLVPSNLSDDILKKTFVTNDHVYLQIQKDRVPVKDSRGLVDIVAVQKHIHSKNH